MSGDEKCSRKAECAECGGIRNCDIVGEHSEFGDDGHVQSWSNWYILKCRGCEYVFIQTATSNSETYDWHVDEHGERQEAYREQVTYWPAISKREWPVWYSELIGETVDVDDLRFALNELYVALDNDSRVLAAIGARLAFDLASKVLGVDGELEFKKKL